MPTIRVEGFNEAPDYMVEKVLMDNTPNLGDATGKAFIQNFEQAISECQKTLEKGYRLTDFWANPDTRSGIDLKKNKRYLV